MPRSASTPNTQASVVLGLIAVQVFFGVHYLAAKLVLSEMPPRGWAFVRIGSAAVVLWIVCLAARRPLPRSGAVWARLALFSVFGVGINQVCFVEGLSRTTPTHSSLINTTIPVMTLTFAVLFGQERVRARKVVALFVALAGVLMVIRPWSAELSETIRQGDLLTLINGTSFAFFLVISRDLMRKIDALAATAILLTFGTLLIGALGVPQLVAIDVGDLSARFWWLAAFIILLPTATAYLINYWALGKVDSSIVAFFIFLQPALAAGLSWIYLGERPAAPTFVGAGLIFIAVALTVRRPAIRDPSSDRR